MIHKLRRLGLGLFPPEKDGASGKGESPSYSDSSRDGLNGFSSSSASSRSSRSSHGPELGQAEHCKPGSLRSSRKSYGLELFEAERRKDRERKEKDSKEEITSRVVDEVPAVVQSRIVEEADAEELGIQDGELCFKDLDHIKLVKKRKVFRNINRNACVECYLIIIPKRIMAHMPKAPNSFVTHPSVPNFFIQVLMVHMSDPHSVDAAVDWLSAQGGDSSKGCSLGLDCQFGTGRVLHLIQLSLHQRCVLIRLSPPSTCGTNPERLEELLETSAVLKTGVEVEDGALAIYWATGMMVNNFKNVSEVHMEKQRPQTLLKIFRKLYKWDWSKRPDITKSDWDRPELSPQQIKYGILNAWSSRMIALQGGGAVEGALTLMSLGNLPRQVLDFFGRAFTDLCKTEESAAQETSVTLSETSCPGALELSQHSYRSRVKGKCTIEVHLKDDEGTVPFKVGSRNGKTVIIVPSENSTSTQYSKNSRKHASGHGISIDSIRDITVLEGKSKQLWWQSKRLWEGLRNIVRNPQSCPKHLRLALGCDAANTHGNGQATDFDDLLSMTSTVDLRSEPFATISLHLNDSQREAWQNILTSPLSATIGPPGTGKTSLITAVAKSWIAATGNADSNEVLLCTAHQNVAVRHLAETLLEGKVPGLMLFISEDYYLGWHEGYYTQLVESLVVSSTDQCEFGINLAGWRTRNEDRESPLVVVCTVDLIGCPNFVSSLMTGKVTALIIDESSQASDMSFLRPLVNLRDLAMVSVLGDPHQLPPYSVIRGEQSVPSVFDLVSNGCRVNFLREQYRMPSSVCEFLSAEIYDNVLMTAPHRLKEKDQRPLVWSHVKGVSVVAPGKTSFYNVAEANAIARFCVTLVRTMGVACERVVVLTPYEEQTRQISRDLAANDLEIPVHNVDSFQGQQCDIVLISLVVARTFSPFAADQRRACVMLSRVRRLLCVFGDFDEVKRNHQAGLWMKLANHCNKRNLVVDEDKVESFLGASIEEAKEMWEPREEKVTPNEFLPASVDAPGKMPPVGIAVQVMFRAR